MLDKAIAFIVANAYLVFTVCAIAGAVMHYLKKIYLKQITNTFLGYWLFDSPGNSLGAAGALGLAIFGVISTKTLDGATWQLIVTSGVLAGWTLDSATSTRGKIDAPATV